MIGSLQSLRFIFALMIFFHHFTVNGETLFYAGGSCGVSFFLILSGFVMSLGYGKQVQMDSFNYKRFLKRRFTRVYPLHILCLAGFIMIAISALSATDYIKLLPNILLLQSWIPSSQYFFSGNAVSWCLSCIMFFYIVFPFIIKKLETGKKNILLIIGVLVISIYTVMVFILPDKWLLPILYIFPVCRILDFIIGIILYKFYRWIESVGVGDKIRAFSFTVKSALEVTLILLLTTFILLIPKIPERFEHASYWWLIMPFFIVLFAIFNTSGGVISRWLNSQILILFGELSFSFFMIHQLAFRVLDILVMKLQITLPWEIIISIYFIIIITISYLVYQYYEKPLAEILNKKF